ncbi:serine/arginine repetitive matrix protein 2-like [Microplitis mediator]|uniref:serine/arginine repetitive matrix protein 2-like n=1 Tax=Microplitis mediator TaxID=375433 RepID=UPI002556BC2D|nr:serine/arginine repetitive matrix protein 2-like [Microplitis mediator]
MFHSPPTTRPTNLDTTWQNNRFMEQISTLTDQVNRTIEQRLIPTNQNNRTTEERPISITPPLIFRTGTTPLASPTPSNRERSISTCFEAMQEHASLSAERRRLEAIEREMARQIEALRSQEEAVAAARRKLTAQTPSSVGYESGYEWINDLESKQIREFLLTLNASVSGTEESRRDRLYRALRRKRHADTPWTINDQPAAITTGNNYEQRPPNEPKNESIREDTDSSSGYSSSDSKRSTTPTSSISSTPTSITPPEMTPTILPKSTPTISPIPTPTTSPNTTSTTSQTPISNPSSKLTSNIPPKTTLTSIISPTTTPTSKMSPKSTIPPKSTPYISPKPTTLPKTTSTSIITPKTTPTSKISPTPKSIISPKPAPRSRRADLRPTIEMKRRGKCFNCRQAGHGHHDCPKPRRSGYCWSCGAENGPNPTCWTCNRYWSRSRNDQAEQRMPTNRLPPNDRPNNDRRSIDYYRTKNRTDQTTNRTSKSGYEVQPDDQTGKRPRRTTTDQREQIDQTPRNPVSMSGGRFCNMRKIRHRPVV